MAYGKFERTKKAKREEIIESKSGCHGKIERSRRTRVERLKYDSEPV